MSKFITKIAVVGLLMGFGSAALAKESKDTKSVLESILAKEGIDFSGEFRAEYGQSDLSVVDGDTRLDGRSTQESEEFTSVDFHITARPNANVSAKAIIRMHQDWRNFFSDLANPIHARWLSLDGNFKDILFFNLGDFRQKWSPLTVFAPELKLLNEAEIFAQEKKEAEKEMFIGGNERLLQGANISFDAGIDGLLDELHLGAFGARLRLARPAESFAASVDESASMEKFAYGVNAGFEVAGINLGGSFINVFDRVNSYTGSTNEQAEALNLIAGRGGFDLAKLIDSKTLIVKVGAEYAMSAYEETTINRAGDSIVAAPIELDASALIADLSLGYKSGKSFKVAANVKYLKNEKDFYNPLAQSATVQKGQIMNTEAGISGDTYESTYYSVFDNIHNSVYKFVPQSTIETADGKSVSHLWTKAPFTKNAYTNETFTKSEIAAFNNVPGHTALMSAGLATANRTGIFTKLTGEFMEKAVTVAGIYKMFSQVTGDTYTYATDGGALIAGTTEERETPLVDYTIMGGGANLALNKFYGSEKKLSIKGSYIAKTVDREAFKALDDADFAGGVDLDIALINAGLYWNFWNRFSVLGGYQVTDVKNGLAAVNSFNEVAMAGGLEYKIADGVYATAKLTNLAVTKNEILDATTMAASEFTYNQNYVNVNMRVQF